MKNKVLKFIVVLGVLFFMLIGGIFALIIYVLPSKKNIGRVITGPEIQQTVQKKSTSVPMSQDQSVVSQSTQMSLDTTSASESEKEKPRPLRREVLENLIDSNQPLSDFCGNLNQLRTQGQPTDATVDKIDSPKFAALMPLMRTIFRDPQMKELILEAQSAVENKEENFWQKATFYSKAALAFQGMISNKPELEAVSDRSYLFFKLGELISQKPDLLTDQRLQKFCEDTELAFNTHQSVQFEQEKKNFERLMDELGVKSEEIKYDSTYKTKFDISFDGQSLQLGGGWLEEITGSVK